MPTVYPGAIKPATPFPSPVPIPLLGTGDVTVTFDQAWLPYILGACKALLAASTWDPPTPQDVANTIFAAYDLLKDLSGAVPAVEALPGGCCDDCECDCMQLRFHNCTLQQFDCITQQWVDVPTDTTCVTNPAPGGGTTPPGAGKCQDYVLNPQANALTPMPFLVTTGDTITVTSELGAGSDGTLDWFCPDGGFFIAGACAGGGGTNPSDPLPTTHHMALILRIGSSYYPLPVGVFTVPGSISSAPAYIQVNDSSPTDDTGQYTVALTYCNNATPPVGSWCHTGNFASTPDGFANRTISTGGSTCTPFTGSAGSYSPGIGFKELSLLQSDCTNHNIYDDIEIDLGAATAITEIDFTGHAQWSGAVAFNTLSIQSSNDPTFASGVTNWYNATQGVGDWSHGGTGTATHRYVRAVLSPAVDGDAAAQSRFYTWTIKGTGPNPFGSSNC